MNNRPLYENLDTAFVNLSALIKYLRQRDFVGLVRVELNNYQAEIFLLEGNKIGVREHDKISGRKSEGEEVFQRLMVRGREPGGTVHVYQTLTETAKFTPQTVVSTENGNGAGHNPIESVSIPIQNGNTTKAAPAAETLVQSDPVAHHAKFPFDLSNRMESKARLAQVTDQDWQALLGLTSELLWTVDQTLADAKLDFKLAFSKARSEISADYPFLHPAARIFDFDNGQVTMQEQVSPRLFVAGVIESLRRILNKLGGNPKFTGIHRATTHKILLLINRHQSLYDKFSITPQLKKVIGV